MNILLSLGLLVVLTLSGCASLSDDDASSTPANTAANEDLSPDSTSSATLPPGEEQEIAYVEVYEFFGSLTGTSLPSRSGMGPELDQMEPTKRDTFEAPAGTTKLLFDTEWPDGTGSMRIEVFGPDGERVYNSHTWTQVEVDGTGAGETWMNEHATDGLGPGSYTVLYYVAGIMDASIRVTATLPAGEPQTAVGQS